MTYNAFLRDRTDGGLLQFCYAAKERVRLKDEERGAALATGWWYPSEHELKRIGRATSGHASSFRVVGVLA